ncbi:MAG: type II toxin-antitoxin system HicB family antitoxin [Proteobacteria bacterium]|jgi:predicted RNase H-like HicB family nuclease|nr:type II toxin-antitoxin system HicB family antitoxin [Pseudomonadota bacterium]
MESIRLTAELIPEEDGGFTVYCPELDIYTQGETEQECLANLKEAAELHIEEIGAARAVRKVIRREIEIRTSA